MASATFRLGPHPRPGRSVLAGHASQSPARPDRDHPPLKENVATEPERVSGASLWRTSFEPLVSSNGKGERPRPRPVLHAPFVAARAGCRRSELPHRLAEAQQFAELKPCLAGILPQGALRALQGRLVPHRDRCGVQVRPAAPPRLRRGPPTPSDCSPPVRLSAAWEPGVDDTASSARRFRESARQRTGSPCWIPSAARFQRSPSLRPPTTE
jgi:hypothetical protein